MRFDIFIAALFICRPWIIMAEEACDTGLDDDLSLLQVHLESEDGKDVVVASEHVQTDSTASASPSLENVLKQIAGSPNSLLYPKLEKMMRNLRQLQRLQRTEQSNQLDTVYKGLDNIRGRLKSVLRNLKFIKKKWPRNDAVVASEYPSRPLPNTLENFATELGNLRYGSLSKMGRELWELQKTKDGQEASMLRQATSDIRGMEGQLWQMEDTVNSVKNFEPPRWR